MPILLFFAFISGLVTILAPCIWPLLPIILSTSINGGRAKSLGITLGIMLSFGAYTLSVSYLVKYLGFNPEILRIFAIVVLVMLGLTMILPPLARLFEGLVSRLAGKVGQGNATRSGFWGGLVTGLSLGIVWTPCAGPILTAIATLSATAQVNLSIIFITVAYLIGVGIPLFFFSYGGQRLVSNTRFLSRYTGIIQQVFGVILILTAVAIWTNYDKILQAKLLDLFPSYSSFLTSFEESELIEREIDRIQDDMGAEGIDLDRQEDETVFNVANPPVAPEFVGIATWLNSPPLTMEALRGKVVLIDFWTYTCINCIRTLPYVTSWYEKYKDDGLVVVGVHTPEFEFEKSTANVEGAIERFDITYPVAQDNDYRTWRAYNNRYWPAKYLVDATGKIRYFHFGEGEYDTTEKAIQLLLQEAGSATDEEMVDLPDQTPRQRVSPETYLGASRMEYYYPSNRIPSGTTQVFTLANTPPLNTFSLGGSWTIEEEFSESGENALLRNHFAANNVFLVMRTATGEPASVRVLLDGKPISSEQAGEDVVSSVVTVSSDRLYHLIDLPEEAAGVHVLTLEFEDPGIQAFAFTFG